jgi:hypothetical protein
MEIKKYDVYLNDDQVEYIKAKMKNWYDGYNTSKRDFVSDYLLYLLLDDMNKDSNKKFE